MMRWSDNIDDIHAQRRLEALAGAVEWQSDYSIQILT